MAQSTNQSEKNPMKEVSEKDRAEKRKNPEAQNSDMKTPKDDGCGC